MWSKRVQMHIIPTKSKNYEQKNGEKIKYFFLKNVKYLFFKVKKMLKNNKTY